MKTALPKRLLGFTLIELLIVIAVLGILMTAVLSAINPIEQLRKGTDTRKRSDAAEFLNALERYYTTFHCYPWQMTSGGSCNTTAISTPTPMSAMIGGAPGTIGSTLDELLLKNEIKKEYLERGGFDEIYVSQDAEDLIHVCFLAESKTFKAAAKTRGLRRDGSSTSCVDTAEDATGCHTCLPE